MIIEEDEEDYCKCIADTSGNQTRMTLCGKRITMDFCFTSIDHAYFNLKNQGRLRICYDCLIEVTNTFDNSV